MSLTAVMTRYASVCYGAQHPRHQLEIITVTVDTKNGGHFAISLLNCFNLPSQIENILHGETYDSTLSIFVLFGHKLPETRTTSTVQRTDQLLSKWHSWRREWYWSTNTTCHYCHYSNVSTLDLRSPNNLHDFIKYQDLTTWSWNKFQEALDI